MGLYFVRAIVPMERFMLVVPRMVSPLQTQRARKELMRRYDPFMAD
jgi:hypothetical protein